MWYQTYPPCPTKTGSNQIFHKKLRFYRNPTWRNNNLPNYAFIDTPREETVNLPNYAFIDPVQTRFYMKKYAFIDTPREEIITLPNYAFIDRLQTGFYGPPPLYDYQNEFSQNISPPAYSMRLPPPYHPKDPNRIKRRKLREFTEEYYLPSYSDIMWGSRLFWSRMYVCKMCYIKWSNN